MSRAGIYDDRAPESSPFGAMIPLVFVRVLTEITVLLDWVAQCRTVQAVIRHRVVTRIGVDNDDTRGDYADRGPDSILASERGRASELSPFGLIRSW